MFKKLLNAVLSLTMALSMLHVSVFAANDEAYQNLALHKSVSASSTASGKDINDVVDGLVESKQTWQNNYATGSEYNRGNGDLVEDLTIDLGNPSTIDKIDLTWTKAVWAKTFSIEGSLDGVTYFSIKEVSDTSITVDMQVQSVTFEEVETRFVKFTFETPNNQTYGYEIYEIAIYGVEEENLAYGKNVTASSTYPLDTFVVEHLVDNNATTRWGNSYKTEPYISGNTEETLVIDLEETYLLSDISLSWEVASASTYTIKASVDGDVYVDVKDVTSDGGFDYHELDQVKCRYLQLALHTPATNYGYSIYDIYVHGDLYVEGASSLLNDLIAEVEGMDLTLCSYTSKVVLQAALEEAKNIASDASETVISSAYKTLNDAKEALEYNIALGKVVEDTILTDGRMDEAWNSEAVKDSFVIDLENEVMLSEMNFYPLYNDAVIYVSMDGTTYHEVEGNVVADCAVVFEPAIRARFIKVETSSSFSEVSAYGEEATTVTKEALQALITTSEGVDFTLYSTSSGNRLKEVIAGAKTVYEDANASAIQISQAYANVEYAYNTLVLKEDLQVLLNSIKNTPPTFSDDGSKINLPELNKDGYEVVIEGTSNPAVIDLEGNIYQPLETMEVNLSYKVVNVEENETAIDSFSETSITIFGKYDTNEEDNARPQVVPALREWKGTNGSLILDETSRIVIASSELKETADMVAFYIKEMTNLDLSVVEGQAQANDIYLSLSDKTELGEEGYYIEINDFVSVEAPYNKGILYAGTTLAQILYQDDMKNELPKGMIRDYPAYEIRAMMIDVARFYMPLDYLQEIAKYMAYYKINEIHVHMNDTGGEQSAAYRIESKKYPEINSNLEPDEVYSQEDYRNFQKDVKKYGIDVITELDTPAHAGFVKLYNPDLVFNNNYINLEKPEAVEFIKSLIDELLDGEDPVIQSEYFHIGVDEYPKEHQDIARKYCDDLIQYVNAKGYKTRLWAALGGSSGLGGDVPVSKDAICNYWSPSFADSRQMILDGYEAINTNRQFLYVVPGSSEPRNIFSIKEAYDGWNMEDLPGVTISTSTPLLKGASAAIWNDSNKGISEFDEFQYIKDQFMLIAEKSWVGKNVGTAEQFEARIDLVDDYAPGANPNRFVASNNEKVVEYDFENIADGSVKDLSGNDYDATINNLEVVEENGNKVLQFNQNGSLSLPFDSIGFPYSISFDFCLDAQPEANAVLFDGGDANGTFYLNYEGENKIGYIRNDFVSTFDYEFVEGKWQNLTFTCDDKDMTLYVDGVKYDTATPAYANAITTTFVLPTQEIGSGVQAKMDNFTIYNRALSYYEIFGSEEVIVENLALNKPVQVSGLEVSDGRWTGEMAVDGDSSTRVSFNKANDAWFIVDLEDVYWVEEIQIDFLESPNKYEVYVSEDGDEWEKVYEDLNCTGGSANLASITFVKNKQVRYVKYQQIEMFTASNDRQYSGNFSEFRVFGSTVNQYADVLQQAKDIIDSTEVNDDNKVYLEQLSNSIDLLENVLETNEEIMIALEGLKDEIKAYEDGQTKVEATNKEVLQNLLENKLTEDTLFMLYYKQGIDVYVSSSATQAEIDEVVRLMNVSLAQANIALHKSVSADVGDGSKVTDGIVSASNFWDGGACPSHFVIDLEHEFFIHELQVYPLYRNYEVRAYEYEIYASCDGVEYELVAEKKVEEAEVAEGTTYAFENAIRARYIKVNMTGNHLNPPYVHMSEVEAYGILAFDTNKDALVQAIEQADAIDPTLYKEDTLVAFNEAYEKAVQVNANLASSQSEIDTATSALNEAMQHLEYLPADYREVNAAKEAANQLNPSDYANFDAVTNAINAVVEGKNISEQAVVDGYAQAIKDALAQLIKLYPNKVENVFVQVVDYKTVQLSWDVVEDASSYIVERFTSNQEWIVVATTSETTFIHTGVKTGKEYTYRVKAVKVYEEQEYVGEASDEVKATTQLSGELQLNVAPNGTSQFDLSWNTVDGATRYVVYRKFNNGEWKKIITLGKDATTYTTNKMVAGTYTYQVKAARYDSIDRIYGSSSNEVSGVVVASASVLTLEKIDVTSVKLSWTKIDAMNGYEVYRKTNNGVYRLLKRVKALEVTNAYLKEGSTYTYKVRSYTMVDGIKVYAPDSNEVTYVAQ